MPIVNMERPSLIGAFVLQPPARASYDVCAGDNVRQRHCTRAVSIVTRQGELGQVNNAIPLRVIHRENVERYGQDGQAVYDAHQISFHAEDGFYIEPGDIIKFGNETLKFKTPLSRNKYGVQLWLCI